MMDSKDEERFSLYESLFEHPGWELFVKEVIEPELEALPERVFRHARTWDEVLAGRAAFSKLAEINALPQIIEQQRDDAEHDPNLEGGGL